MHGVVVTSTSPHWRTIAQALECKELGAQQALLGEQQSLSVHGGSRLCIAQQLVLGCWRPEMAGLMLGKMDWLLHNVWSAECGLHFEGLLLLVIAQLGQIERVQQLSGGKGQKENDENDEESCSVQHIPTCTLS